MLSKSPASQHFIAAQKSSQFLHKEQQVAKLVEVCEDLDPGKKGYVST